jgi:hypothetical protein
LKRLRCHVHKFGGDPEAAASTSELRLPGVLNRKYEAEFLVQAVKHADVVYHPQDFHLRTEFVVADFTPAVSSPRYCQVNGGC